MDEEKRQEPEPEDIIRALMHVAGLVDLYRAEVPEALAASAEATLSGLGVLDTIRTGRDLQEGEKRPEFAEVVRRLVTQIMQQQGQIERMREGFQILARRIINRSTEIHQQLHAIKDMKENEKGYLKRISELERELEDVRRYKEELYGKGNESAGASDRKMDAKARP